MPVEKELHKMRRHMTSIYKQAKFNEFLDVAIDFEQKVNTVMGKDNVIYASCLNNLALAQKSVGNIDDAIDTYEHSLDVYKEVVGTSHPSYATVLGNLGNNNYVKLYDRDLKLQLEL